MVLPITPKHCTARIKFASKILFSSKNDILTSCAQGNMHLQLHLNCVLFLKLVVLFFQFTENAGWYLINIWSTDDENHDWCEPGRPLLLLKTMWTTRNNWNKKLHKITDFFYIKKTNANREYILRLYQHCVFCHLDNLVVIELLELWWYTQLL